MRGLIARQRQRARDPLRICLPFRGALGVRTRPRVDFWGMAPAQKRCGDASHSQSAAREMWFEARTRCPQKQGTREFPNQSFVTCNPRNLLTHPHGLGCGLGRGLGVTLGGAVGEGVVVGVGVGLPGGSLGVGVADGVADGVAVGVGVGVGDPPPTAARISTRPHP